MDSKDQRTQGDGRQDDGWTTSLAWRKREERQMNEEIVERQQRRQRWQRGLPYDHVGQ